MPKLVTALVVAVTVVVMGLCVVGFSYTILDKSQQVNAIVFTIIFFATPVVIGICVRGLTLLAAIASRSQLADRDDPTLDDVPGPRRDLKVNGEHVDHDQWTPSHVVP